VGGALFKPVISATIAKTTNKDNSSIGFGIFYMMVNLGAMIGPFVASKLRETSWDYVFYLSAAIIALNFVLVLFFYKEPPREKNESKLWASIAQALKNIFIALKDVRFFLFLLLIIGFWSMYFQLFYTLPVFIDQWIDTRNLYQWMAAISPVLANIFGTPQGTVNPEMILNVDALYIVVFQVIVSSVVMRLRPINAMIVGIVIASIGIGLTFMYNNAFFLFFSILIFAFGEMASSPKITEYIGRIAPPDKVGLYMGCSFLPMSGGNFFAGLLSGPVYGSWSDKVFLLRQDMASKGIKMPEISESFTQNELIFEAARAYNMTVPELTNYLWDTYNPADIWWLFTGIGLATALLLFAYDRLLMRNRKNVA
jgi:MFS family permease